MTGTPRGDCAGPTTLALKIGGSAPSSGPFRLAVCVLGTGRNSVSTPALFFTPISYFKKSHRVCVHQKGPVNADLNHMSVRASTPDTAHGLTRSENALGTACQAGLTPPVFCFFLFEL